ncbi:BTB/POZ domain-containing protein At1g21780 isoform X2 [Malania oleifera]|uniref:BTB/POZ domain-containing protein At1g21780 isoform X2 n=1 Tax=Malania oleifera TaxID=397392 RepID=UPI0025AE6F63|nr:BTB/POZ domain-containing protein At1g21780 isoform X2 [Malania oleifera]
MTVYFSCLSLAGQVVEYLEGRGRGSDGDMCDSKVETISRLVQWRIENFGPCSYKKSDPFKIGLWNWHLSVEKNRHMHIKLFPEPSRMSKEQPPIASFILRVNTGPGRKPYISPIHERLLRTSEDFLWPIDSTFLGRFIIDVEFLDLKICPLNGGEASSIWPSDGMMQSLATQSTLQCLSRMLNESIHSDVTINTTDGTLKAHKAVLSASSPVFESMFLHDLKEKESSTIIIEDMSLEACAALLNYLYGTIKQEDFWKHRLALLAAANKYGISNLKDSCEENLLEDINSSNALERLQVAWLYQLNKLKKGCLMYLFDFGKIYDLREEINNFFRQADRELMLEMFQELLTVWKPT